MDRKNHKNSSAFCRGCIVFGKEMKDLEKMPKTVQKKILGSNECLFDLVPCTGLVQD